MLGFNKPLSFKYCGNMLKVSFWFFHLAVIILNLALRHPGSMYSNSKESIIVSLCYMKKLTFINYPPVSEFVTSEPEINTLQG